MHKNYKWPAKDSGEESLVQAIKRQVKDKPSDFGFDRVYIGPQSMRTFRIKYIKE